MNSIQNKDIFFPPPLFPFFSLGFGHTRDIKACHGVTYGRLNLLPCRHKRLGIGVDIVTQRGQGPSRKPRNHQGTTIRDIFER